MTNPNRAGSIPDLVARVQALEALIAENASLAEQQRRPVDEVIAALEATGVFRSYVPKRFGGFEIDTDTFIDIGIAISRACTSTGWVTCFYMEHNWMLAQFPPETQEEIFGRQPYILAPASISPTGAAQRKDDGYVLSGRWSWGTGIMHADWVLLNGIVPGDVSDVSDVSGSPKIPALPRDPVTGSRAELVLEMRSRGARFVGAPSLLDSLETSALLRRHRSRPSGGEVSLSITAEPS